MNHLKYSFWPGSSHYLPPTLGEKCTYHCTIYSTQYTQTINSSSKICVYIKGLDSALVWETAVCCYIRFYKNESVLHIRTVTHCLPQMIKILLPFFWLHQTSDSFPSDFMSQMVCCSLFDLNALESIFRRLMDSQQQLSFKCYNRVLGMFKQNNDVNIDRRQMH